MSENDFIEGYEGNLFIQTDPADEYMFLTCTGVGGITFPKGARTIKYKQDLRRSGRLVAAGAIKGAPDFTTASITRPLSSVNNYLHEIDCPFNVRINWACRGTRTVFSNYQVGLLLYDSAFTSGAIPNPLSGGETDNDRVNTTGELSASLHTYVYALEGAALTLTSSSEVFSIAVVPSECASKCGDKIGLGQDVWIGLEGNTYLVGYIMHSTDYGATWTPPTWSPFTTAGDVSSIVIVDNQNGYRIIVSRGDSIGGVHAEISYSDDEGDTGTDVDVGTVDGQTIQMLRKDPRGRVWAAASGGYIYVSQNNGVTWTASSSGTATAQSLYDIAFYSDTVGYAVGNANAFLKWDGSSWNAGTGPAVGVNLLSCDVNYAGHVFVTTEDAELYRSDDEGDTWELMLNLAADNITQIRFDEDFRYFGYLTYNSAAPLGTLYRSEDAGNTWAIVGVPATDYTNLGLNCVAICDPNMVYVGGAPVGGLSFVAKFVRQS